MQQSQSSAAHIETVTATNESLAPFSWLTIDSQSAGFNSTSLGGIRID